MVRYFRNFSSFAFQFIFVYVSSSLKFKVSYSKSFIVAKQIFFAKIERLLALGLLCFYPDQLYILWQD